MARGAGLNKSRGRTGGFALGKRFLSEFRSSLSHPPATPILLFNFPLAFLAETGCYAIHGLSEETGNYAILGHFI